MGNGETTTNANDSPSIVFAIPANSPVASQSSAPHPYSTEEDKQAALPFPLPQSPGTSSGSGGNASPLSWILPLVEGILGSIHPPTQAKEQIVEDKNEPFDFNFGPFHYSYAAEKFAPSPSP
eukprot:TRINITY_DN12019_c0_g1_i1.p1 TRINITY_DN12019_c0_g1~~TRINITY_DN12019_c0_g1_i1.p1  ORF type:complete len:122 (+),score=26.78 TRINITY_DN12019_c0_g1_i1:101-466(+)